jgi:hypothetical protein
MASRPVDLFEYIWTNTARTLASVLLHNETGPTHRRTVTSFWQYQVAGVSALLRHSTVDGGMAAR